MASPVIQVAGVRKTYGSTVAVDDLERDVVHGNGRAVRLPEAGDRDYGIHAMPSGPVPV